MYTASKDIKFFIEDFGFITTYIAANVIYKNKTFPRNQARRKLKDMNDKKQIKRFKSSSGEYIYTNDFKSNISAHKKVLIELFSFIYNQSKDVEYFKIEEPWMNNKYRSDGHIIYLDNDNYLKSFLIEIEFYHKTDKKKYIDIYESGEVQQWYYKKYDIDNYFPSIIIINQSGIKKFDYTFTDIISCNYKFEGLEI